MNYKHEWIANNVIITYSGVVTREDIIDSVNLTISDSRFDSSKFQVADFTDVTEMKLDDNAMRIISTLDKSASRWNECMKIANVSTNPEIIDKIKIYNDFMASSSWKTKVFSNLKDALRWGYSKSDI